MSEFGCPKGCRRSGMGDRGGVVSDEHNGMPKLSFSKYSIVQNCMHNVPWMPPLPQAPTCGDQIPIDRATTMLLQCQCHYSLAGLEEFCQALCSFNSQLVFRNVQHHHLPARSLRWLLKQKSQHDCTLVRPAGAQRAEKIHNSISTLLTINIIVRNIQRCNRPESRPYVTHTVQ